MIPKKSAGSLWGPTMLAVALGPPVIVTIPPGPRAGMVEGGAVVPVPELIAPELVATKLIAPELILVAANAGWPIPSACHG